MSAVPKRSAQETGWGGRIRTCECRYQKPVPYRLATPQQGRPVDRALVVRARLIVAMRRLKSSESGRPALFHGHVIFELLGDYRAAEIEALELRAAQLAH